MRASLRKEVESLLIAIQPRSTSHRQVLERLQEAFREKRFLSKRELKELASLKSDTSQAA